MIYELDKDKIQDINNIRDILYAIVGQIDSATMDLIIAANPEISQYFKVKNV